MPFRFFSPALGLAAFVLICGPGAGAPAQPKAIRTIDFNHDVRPILSDYCYACHGPDESRRKAGLRLDLEEGAFQELKSGKRAVVRGDLAKSALIQHILSNDPDEIMPSPKAADPLPPGKIELLKRWIQEGAPWERHWSFIPPQRSALPAVLDESWPRNALDYFILARLEK